MLFAPGVEERGLARVSIKHKGQAPAKLTIYSLNVTGGFEGSRPFLTKSRSLSFCYLTFSQLLIDKSSVCSQESLEGKMGNITPTSILNHIVIPADQIFANTFMLRDKDQDRPAAFKFDGVRHHHFSLAAILANPTSLASALGPGGDGNDVDPVVANLLGIFQKVQAEGKDMDIKASELMRQTARIAASELATLWETNYADEDGSAADIVEPTEDGAEADKAFIALAIRYVENVSLNEHGMFTRPGACESKFSRIGHRGGRTLLTWCDSYRCGQLFTGR